MLAEMTSRKLFIRKSLAALLALNMAIQPVVASTFQYNVFVKGFVGKKTTEGSGSGLGDVDLGDNPTPEEPNTPRLTLRRAVLSYDMDVGEPEVTQLSIVESTGTIAAPIAGIVSNEDFAVSTDCPSYLAVGETCKIFATYNPTSVGDAEYVMPIDVAGARKVPQLQMVAHVVDPTTTPQHGPRLRASPLSNVLSAVDPGVSATTSTVVTNIGDESAKISGFISAGNGFTTSNDCPEALAPQSTCEITAVFRSFVPQSHYLGMNLTTQTGKVTAIGFSATVTDNPSITPRLAVSPAKIIFPQMAAGTTAQQTATLTNSGTAPAILAALTSSTDFAVSSDCPAELGVNQSCNIAVTYTAKEASAPSYSLNIAAQNNVHAILLLMGSNLAKDSDVAALTFDTPSLEFGSVPVQTSVSKTALLTNNSTSTVDIQAVNQSGTTKTFIPNSDCVGALAPGASCNVQVTFNPATVGDASDRIQIKTSKGVSALLGLGGRGLGGTLTVGPTVIKFGTLSYSEQPIPKNIGIYNSGNAPLTGLTVADKTGPATLDFSGCPATLKGNENCTAVLSVIPSTVGPFSGSVTIQTDGGFTKVVQYTGITAKFNASPSTLNFGQVQVGTSQVGLASAASATDNNQTVTLTNEGSLAVNYDSIGVASGQGNFNQSNNCGTSLAAGAACDIVVKFTPSTGGTLKGKLYVASGSNALASITLEGTGEAPALTVSPTSVSFPSVKVGVASTPQTVQISNLSGYTATGVSVSVSGTSKGFGQTNNCGATLVNGASCSVTVTLTPNDTANMQANLTVANSFGTQTVSLSGVTATGTPVGGTSEGTPTTGSDGYQHYSITFLNTELGSSSAVRNVTFSNKGTGPLNILSLGIAAGESDFNQNNNCGSVLQPGEACTIALQFTPNGSGTRKGGVLLLSDAGGFYFDLSGPAAAGAVKWAAAQSTDFGVIAVGTPVTRSFTLKNSGNGAAKQLVTTLNANGLTFTKNTCGTASTPVNLAANTSCSVTVQYAPSTADTLSGAFLTTTGVFVDGSASIGLTGSALVSAFAFDATPSADFGIVGVGVTNSQTFVLRNNGAKDTLTIAPTIEGEGFTITGGTCKVNLSLAANATCTVIVAEASTTPGPLQAVVKIGSKAGVTSSLNLQATVVEPVLSISGAAASDTPIPYMGSIARSVTATQYVYLRDNNSSSLIKTSAISLGGSSNFAIKDIAVVLPTGSKAASCDLSGVCAGTLKTHVIRIQLAYTAAGTGADSAVLHIEHNGVGGRSDVTVSGDSLYDISVKAGSTYGGSTITTTNSKVTVGSSVGIPIYLTSVGSYGRLGVDVVIEGDSDFTLGTMRQTNGVSVSVVCGTIAADGRSGSNCFGTERSTTSGTTVNVAVTAKFAPSSVGEHTGTMIITHSGLNTPNPIVVPLIGTGK